MSSLDWSNMVEKFFAFRGAADKVGFYTPELDRMEQSLIDINPVRGLEFKDVLSSREEYHHVAPSV